MKAKKLLSTAFLAVSLAFLPISTTASNAHSIESQVSPCMPLDSINDLQAPYLASSDPFGHEIQCRRRIPAHLLMAGYTNRVNLKLFSTKVSGKSVRYREDRKKYMIDKDRDGHKGSCWKLLDRNRNRIASLRCDGVQVGD